MATDNESIPVQPDEPRDTFGRCPCLRCGTLRDRDTANCSNCGWRYIPPITSLSYEPKPELRWYQYNLQALLLLITVAAVVLSLVMLFRQP
jgi:hypothetical protein